ncbi:Metalloexopeptidase [Handroanthus impetiginosus]|uniref:Acetylornithine deacetylase n=1 Tax=Handroanthus impetiginosus TaxID=429701 RepID=A0A2G9GHT9_9LAMI|nr:Metalloexopeptidase [Handroanthus impetiginosus]
MSGASIIQTLGDLNRDDYVDLLSKLIGESQHVQNNPPNLIPEEDRIVNHVLDVLLPYSTTNGGPLVINHITYVPNRGNLIVEYPGTQADKIVSFVGMHMDVVTANPSQWAFDPFSLSIEGDQLRGRGTTDCLGHVALVAELMKKLGKTKIPLKSTVVAVFIASEENSSIPGVGVDALDEHGWLEKLKPGPLYWVDSADKQPCIGTAGTIQWHFKTTGKLFHSGLPNRAINALELGMEALKVIQLQFYEDFPPHPQEEVYGFETPSTMKPTQWAYPEGSINQIPGECTVSGDVRLTPFYSIDDVLKKLRDHIDYVNDNVETLDTRGPVSKYVLPDEKRRGKVEITFGTENIPGIACNLESRGYQVLAKATEEVIGYVKPYSITGTLPLVHDLQDKGYDVQNIGYGLTEVYHANNEYCNFSDMAQGYAVFVRIISQLEED